MGAGFGRPANFLRPRGETVTFSSTKTWQAPKGQAPGLAHGVLFPLGLTLSKNAEDDLDGTGQGAAGWPQRSRYLVQVLAYGAWGWPWECF